MIGKVMKIDYNTTKDDKYSRFAHVTVVVDLKNLLVFGILINGHHHRIEYKGMPLICYSCGRYVTLRIVVPMCIMSNISKK
ncbi:hypothetical protein GQ457_02G030670 [Hibiscus cannabinus]